VCAEEKHWLADIQKLIKFEIPQEVVPGFDPDPEFFEAGTRHRGRRSNPGGDSASMPAEPRRSGAADGRRGAAGEPRAARSSATGRPRPQRSTVAPDGFDFSKPYESSKPPSAHADIPA